MKKGYSYRSGKFIPDEVLSPCNKKDKWKIMAQIHTGDSRR